MDSTDQFRARYARTDDDNLRALLAIEPAHLTAEARQALAEEVARRGLRGPGETSFTDPLDAIVWPEIPVRRQYPKASLGARFLAHLIDLAVGVIPMFAAAFLLIFGFGQPFSTTTPLVVGLVVGFIWMLYYGFTKDGRAEGQSVGKQLLNLMVVNVTTNRPCSKSESALRALDLFLLQLIPIVGWLVEPIVALSAEDGRRLGDRAAGTQVIDASEYRPSPGPT